MPSVLRLFWLTLFTALMLHGAGGIAAQQAEPLAASSQPQPIWQLKLSGIIGPASSDLVTRTLADAAAQHVHLLVIELDTPGGLDSAMREMIRQITDSPVPVATYVAPNGARAASAGTYLLLASHIAAMAPATNLGAATPVQIGMQPPQPPGKEKGGEEDKAAQRTLDNPMQQKIMNDAAAYIRSLAELHGRNADWAEKAVREAASLSASDALEQRVIDLIATDIHALLRQVDGRELRVRNQPYILDTATPALSEVTTDWRYDFLSVITNPNVAYILMLAGIYGLLLEFYNPGVGLPGIVGGISLLVALYAFQLLPISYAGLGLIALGIGLMVVEALSPSFGIFGLGGAAAFAIGSVLLMDTDLPAFQIALPIVAAFTAVTGGLCIFILAMALRARRRAVVSGIDMLIGAQAVALENFQHNGKVRLKGEIWNAHSTHPVSAGTCIRVVAVHGLLLEVTPDDDSANLNVRPVHSRNGE